MNKPIEPDDAVLRRLGAADVPALVALTLRWQFRPQVEEFVGDTSSAEKAASFIESHRRDDTWLLGVWVGGDLAGLVILRLVGAHAATLDYLLERDYRGRGLMTRACGAVLRFLLGDLRRHRAEIQCDTVNAASRAIAERLGFRLEGVRREAAHYGSSRGDVAIYGLLAPEWVPPDDVLEWVKA